jgi:hypothetical protein
MTKMRIAIIEMHSEGFERLIVDSYIVDCSLPLTSKLSTNQPRLSFFCDLTFSLTSVSELAFCKVRNLYSFVSASFSSALVGVNRGFKKYVFAGIKRKSILFSIKSLVLLTALATILVLLTAITVSATVYSPWTREAVDTTSTTDIQCAKVGDADNDGLVEVVIGIDGMGDNIYMYESPSPDSTLQFIDPTPANYTQEQEFSWGLVSLNTRKSIYKPGETAEFIIVVLDKDGRPVSGADISMTVTSPNDKKTTYSTVARTIIPGEECGLYNASYLTEVEGNHTITVATTIGGVEVAFDTYFPVQQEYAFDIIRTAQSKIDPTKQDRFDVTIDIESFTDAHADSPCRQVGLANPQIV